MSGKQFFLFLVSILLIICVIVLFMSFIDPGYVRVVVGVTSIMLLIGYIVAILNYDSKECNRKFFRAQRERLSALEVEYEESREKGEIF